MARFSLIAGILVVACLLPGLATLLAQDPASPLTQRESRSPQRPGVTYDWEEWGVWLVRVTDNRTLVDVGWLEELPEFVERYPAEPVGEDDPQPQPVQPQPIQPPPGPPPWDPDHPNHPPVARKPVAWLFPAAGQEPFRLSVRVDASPHGGAAWPPCSSLTSFRDRREQPVFFWGNLTVGAMGDLPALPDAEDGEAEAHWWRHLRAVEGAARLAGQEGSRAQCLFYESPTPDGLRAILDVGGARRFEFSQPGEDLLVKVTGRGVETRELVATWETLRAQIIEAGTALGLREATAAALADVWEPELSSMEAGASWTVFGTEAYDALLSLELNPAPTERVRVGVIVRYP